MNQALEDRLVEELKTIYDPEIPVNIYDLGLIYNLKEENGKLEVEMTLTAPGCPVADSILAEIKQKLELVDGIKEVVVDLVFDPPWNMDMITEEAKLELGML
ncbi:MAG TPA: FeS assembly SUF system protein [Marinilabiliales bacterium]|jgi:FeS assembly SUF system protein|nr:MAG: FeS assembly SUF system protein [Bacteroidetes bacterium GWA2_40_14]OFX66148.1 MAG: FeS assembly SUF system protein [Bacteroidetes bacterium GWC2_40_13]OFX71620.1 MAG: FeS assembly SUF system protein [Bacteroidetes bacterium GWD2_40_43]OFX88664.1 MAG: FeS assembly SUF system protein [Bacteroidetes bacterium GWE2_40_63]OFY22688.1 MAG: FeS assembly SUF system protein [Bacteroidetes bacterium GWF2_40_13]OFZ24098.1 MAG: FeS assembly SUF system protein [Bacteroidetes bacterium RIFOXYC2_FULL